jgi:hypothetical protein
VSVITIHSVVLLFCWCLLVPIFAISKVRVGLYFHFVRGLVHLCDTERDACAGLKLLTGLTKLVRSKVSDQNKVRPTELFGALK